MGSVKTTYVPWVVFATALLAWGFVGFFAWSLSHAEVARVAEEASVTQKTTQREAALRLHALVRDTKDARAALDSLAQTDVVSMVEALEAVGDATRAHIEIGQVLAGNFLPGASPEDTSVRAITVVVEAQGTFAMIVHTAALLYSLPVPSVVDQLQLDRLPKEADTSDGPWWLVARVRVLTTAEISS